MKTALILLVVCWLAVLPWSARAAGSPVNRLSDDSADAMEDAMVIFHGVSLSDCLRGNNANRQDCVTLESDPASVARGIAAFGVSDAGQNGGFGAALGKTIDGQWKLWFTSQNPYQLIRLPGQMAVCSGGEGINLRSGPSSDADSVGGYADGTVVDGEQFVLTEPVDPGHIGYGWFRISSPDSGWLYSKYLEAATLNDNCALHNAQVGP
jgi:hypothetical protein